MHTPKRDIVDVYDALTATIDDLRSKKMDVARGNAIANVANAAINAGKLECRMIDLVGGHGTGFIPTEQKPALPASAGPLKMLQGWGRK